MSRQVDREERRARRAELPYWRQPSFIAAAVFVGAVVLAGLFLLAISGQRPSGSPTPTAESTPEPAQTAAPGEDPHTATGSGPAAPGEPAPGAGQCPPMSSDSAQSALQIAPEVQWSPVGDVATAASAQDGPADTEGPKRCYAQTAAGGLIAAHNFIADANSGVPLQDLLEERVAEDGPVYDVTAADAEAGRQSSGRSITVSHYRFIEATEDQHTVALIYVVPQTSASALMEMRVTVRWINGDWMVWDSPEPQQVSAVPAGFIEWGPLAGSSE